MTGSKFFGNKHNKQNHKGKQTFKSNSKGKGKGANMGIRKVGRGS
tara:strand:- start:2904 stop:3038 length:135 start_codon:yes stop_codon:yes gene_type:complete